MSFGTVIAQEGGGGKVRIGGEVHDVRFKPGAPSDLIGCRIAVKQPHEYWDGSAYATFGEHNPTPPEQAHDSFVHIKTPDLEPARTSKSWFRRLIGG